ncbi:MAG: hypothetical protein PHW34_02925 [Hespellia sp.]|nr:hypothetical protein [Hespellia sp.]
MNLNNTLKRRVECEKDTERRSHRLKAFSSWKHLKTTSEWQQNCPVIPLSSSMSGTDEYQRKLGGTASEDLKARPFLQKCSEGRAFCVPARLRAV